MALGPIESDAGNRAVLLVEELLERRWVAHSCDRGAGQYGARSGIVDDIQPAPIGLAPRNLCAGPLQPRPLAVAWTQRHVKTIGQQGNVPRYHRPAAGRSDLRRHRKQALQTVADGIAASGIRSVGADECSPILVQRDQSIEIAGVGALGEETVQILGVIDEHSCPPFPMTLLRKLEHPQLRMVLSKN